MSAPHVDAARAVKAVWDERRAVAVERAMHRKRRARTVAATLALLVATLGVSLKFAPAPDVTVAPLDPSSDVRLQPESAVVTAGGAWFDVRPNPKRVFRVEAGDVTVEVLGTRFAVEKTEHNVRVQVDHGKVRVKWKGGERLLTNGMEGWFALAVPVPEERPAPSLGELVVRESKATAQARPRQSTADELLHAADTARQDGVPKDAVGPLEQLIARFPTDARAPLAAFTLGRIQLDQLKQPRPAAAAFAKARALDPAGPLAEDALARQVIATAFAGDREEARRLATEYLALFPNGRSVNAVRHHGGVP